MADFWDGMFCGVGIGVIAADIFEISGKIADVVFGSRPGIPDP